MNLKAWITIPKVVIANGFTRVTTCFYGEDESNLDSEDEDTTLTFDENLVLKVPSVEQKTEWILCCEDGLSAIESE